MAILPGRHSIIRSYGGRQATPLPYPGEKVDPNPGEFNLLGRIG